MRKRPVGDVRVGEIAVGAMALSRPGRPSTQEAVRAVHAALDAGVTLIDTSPSYHDTPEERGHSELLVARALRERPTSGNEVMVATKVGHIRQAGGTIAVDGSPDHIRRSAQESAGRLGVDSIDLLQLHRPDPQVPYAESVGELGRLVDRGLVRAVGISNVGTDEVEVAASVLGPRLVSVQNRYSPGHRESHDVLELCARRGLAFLAWSPLGGKGSGEITSAPAFLAVGLAHGVGPHQVCLAWELRLSPGFIPIPGITSGARAADCAAASRLDLTDEELDQLPALT
ncbi:MAG TPA: aldo/keto reductase [Nocardioides sp.]|jgi:aryl-alcohol dehydrogenase-like predicted oxidoreductase|uniref:aldo/keto reductase n=1 Tax=Nocardioides sp. TaxID=35761 RepID=UPI002E34F8D5|nr:aldo/keto reductase [Nocardioides sp.]HEX3931815.1 aldo/keto reductase [Nocardioides sp.]